MGEEIVELADDHRFLISINETVAFYVLFTAPNDEAAVEEAEKLWDEEKRSTFNATSRTFGKLLSK